MHSVRRVKTTEEQRAARRRREAGEIARFRKLDAEVLSRPHDREALNRTTQLLSINPEHYTVWNIRRELIASLNAETGKLQALQHDLKLTESLLPTHPKVYWIWNHRRWVLIELNKTGTGAQPAADEHWIRELALTTKLLDRDARNFHGWSYRRWVVENSEVTTLENEFAFTTKKINENFSNFSAWHYRSQLIGLLAEKPPLNAELSYVYEAVAMDPQDQSGWLYYQWLLVSGAYEVSAAVLAEQIELITEIWDEEKSVWAGRLLLELARSKHEPVDSQIVDSLVKLDPLHKKKYLALKEQNI